MDVRLERNTVKVLNIWLNTPQKSEKVYSQN